MQVNDPKLKAACDHITDVFTGGDGGAGFLAFKMTVEELAGKKDDDSKDLLEIVLKFNKFLHACKRLRFPGLDL